MTDYSNWTSEDFEAILEQSSFLSQHEARALLDRHALLEKELVETVANRMRSLERVLSLEAALARVRKAIGGRSDDTAGRVAAALTGPTASVCAHPVLLESFPPQCKDCGAVVRQDQGASEAPMVGGPEHVEFWRAIHEYVYACGGQTETASARKMGAVVTVEKAAARWAHPAHVEQRPNEANRYVPGTDPAFEAWAKNDVENDERRARALREKAQRTDNPLPEDDRTRLELPMVPNDHVDEQGITCIFCRSEKPCEYAIRVLRDGERALVGIHEKCVAPLRRRNAPRPETARVCTCDCRNCAGCTYAKNLPRPETPEAEQARKDRVDVGVYAAHAVGVVAAAHAFLDAISEGAYAYPHAEWMALSDALIDLSKSTRTGSTGK